ncbi:hypothetical protein QLL95_gp0690 [Cotonvirus japonicus]|uniref:Uncharacterized protein n=1 Tax=Cotonvirus japonicus TaxID=2811091 RepID=A0ABM7NTE1_9VIRU|nr:hypothetical protein QLL95_gp0690 [Cotonvirus japonicus]BCS83433.1 hypothetical protein [Cotonvirus japonicus]
MSTKIDDIDVLENYFKDFVNNDEKTITVLVNSNLRRDMRKFKTIFTTIYYFAYGLGDYYELVISKSKFDIDFHRLSLKTKKTFCDHTGYRIGPETSQEIMNKLYEYLHLDVWHNTLNEVMFYCNGEREFINKHFDYQKKVHVELSKNVNLLESWNNLIVEKSSIFTKRAKMFSQSANSRGKGDSIYKPGNDKKYFMSIDMSAANFQIIKTLGLTQHESWCDVISQYTDNAYFINSKKLRLIALSYPNLHPKKQSIYWGNIILDVMDHLLENKILLEKDFVVFNGDEIIFIVDSDKKQQLSIINDCMSITQKNFSNFKFKINVFQLRTVKVNERYYYAKINQLTNSIEWKCVTIDVLPEVLACWNSMNITPE